MHGGKLDISWGAHSDFRWSGRISANQQMYATINTTKSISTIDLESTGETSGNILSQSFSVREETTVFADISVNLRGIGSSEIKTNLLFEDVENRIFFQYIFWAEYCKK